jgi:hypothetical protein
VGHYYVTSEVVIINTFIYRNALMNAVEPATKMAAELCPKK